MQETPKTLSTSREGIPGGNTHWWKKKSKNLKDITMDNQQKNKVSQRICVKHRNKTTALVCFYDDIFPTFGES